MKKKEWVYRQILYEVLERKEKKHTQLSLAKVLRISLSTVNNALKPLSAMGAIEVKGMGFRVIDAGKMLAYWGSVRNLQKDVIYETRVGAGISEIEKSMPSGIIYTAYSAYKFKFADVPSDYSEVYIYADEKTLLDIKERFPKRKGPPNLFVLIGDEALRKCAPKNLAPAGQIYADLWNINTWYAKEFLKALEKRLRI